MGENLAVRKKAAKTRVRRAKKVQARRAPARKVPARKAPVKKALKPLKKAPKAMKKAPKPLKKPGRDEEKELALKAAEEEHAFTHRISRILSDSGVRQNLIELGGENALAIVRNFYGNHSDEEIAKRLKIKISDVRATLNKLHNEGLVNYIREKDNETGWYSYSWSLNQERMERWATGQAGRLSAIAQDTGVDYYFCPGCGASSITNFESAAGMDFRCERCNRLLEFIDERRLCELHEKK